MRHQDCEQDGDTAQHQPFYGPRVPDEDHRHGRHEENGDDEQECARDDHA